MIKNELNTDLGISVIICCHNSGAKIRPTLKALAQQTDISQIPVEIILVDNNSTDGTVTIARELWARLGQPFPLKIVDEKIAGLSFARTRGILTSQYQYLIFCDDDNWLNKEYLSIVHNLFDTKEEVAMIGGVGVGLLQKQAPEWFQRLNGFGYAIGDEGRQTGYTDSVYGAGMAIRKDIMQALHNQQISFILSDRVGKNLSSGGDSEMCALVKAAGKRIWFDKRLTFDHDLPQSRINWKYYRKLRYAFGCAGVFLNLYNESITIPAKGVALKNLMYYMGRYFYLLLLGFFLKTEKHAYAIQQLGKFATTYFDHHKLTEALEIATANKKFLATISK